MINRAGGLSGA